MTRRKVAPTFEEREALRQRIISGDLTLGDAVRALRKLTGLTQDDFAEKVLGIYPRVLKEIENGRGNPTRETLEKIASPFGLTVGFVPKKKPPIT